MAKFATAGHTYETGCALQYCPNTMKSQYSEVYFEVVSAVLEKCTGVSSPLSGCYYKTNKIKQYW